MKWLMVMVTGILIITGLLLSFNPNVRGAVKLALSTSSLITLSSENDTKTVMTKMNDGEGFQQIISQVEGEGWVLSDQLGSTFIFTKGEESLVLMVKMWTNQYIVAEMTEG